MKTTLIKILYKKELIHWKRVKMIFHKFNGWFGRLTWGVLIAFFITLFHYMFMFMHTLWELTLFVFNRNKFKANIQKMSLTV